MSSRPVPTGAPFAFEMGIRSLDEQLKRIEALDSKAGTPIAAGAVFFGLILGREALLTDFPRWVTVPATVSLVLAVVLALMAFANRRYEFAPKPEAVIRVMAAREEWIKWRSLGNIADVLATNRRKLLWKARLLSAGLATLIVAVATLGGYFLYKLAVYGWS